MGKRFWPRSIGTLWIPREGIVVGGIPVRAALVGALLRSINAIENQVEEGDGDPTVVRHLGDALLALAAVHQLEPRTVKKLTQTLGELHAHLTSSAQAPIPTKCPNRSRWRRASVRSIDSASRAACSS